MSHSLPPSPEKIELFNEIAIRCKPGLSELFNEITPQERIFIYYMYRACVPGNAIAADQKHRHARTIMAICEELFHKADMLAQHQQWNRSVDHAAFIKQLETYLVYIWSNHSQYFAKEHAQEKRSPARLELSLITQETLELALTVLENSQLKAQLRECAASFFDHRHEPTNCVANNIAESAVNFYAPDFTDEHFESLSLAERSSINAYYALEQDGQKEKIRIERYKIGGKYSAELEVAAYWLQKAADHAKNYPAQFDSHMVDSLEKLILFLHTGDEEDFRKHCISWLKINNRIDYVFGFIENYQDPKEFRGMFEAEVTIKALDMQKLNALLPECEKRLPFDAAYKRENLDNGAGLPNASLNVQFFGSGDAGPLGITAAYCLPNYEDIRASHGSKQVIYQVEKSLGALLNPELHNELFYLTDQVEFLRLHDADGQLSRDIWKVHCILHETLGHGSGRLATHIFKEGENLIVDGKKYAVGDTLELTPENSNHFFAGTASSLEELRAEIIALYTSICMFDELAQAGLYGHWPEKIGKEKLIEWLIFDMMHTGLRRLQTQPKDSQEINGAHAQANSIIMNYILDSGAVALVKEQKNTAGKIYSVLGFKIIDLKKACDVITQLAIEVQTIKSTADGMQFKAMLDRYGRFVRSQEHLQILQDNLKAVVGNLKVIASIYPRLQPVFDAHGTLVDIQASWPATFTQQQLEYAQLAYSTSEKVQFSANQEQIAPMQQPTF